jgi:hypothetical protein
MTAIFLALIQSLNSSVVILLLLLILAFILLYKLGVWATTFKHHESKINEAISIKELVVRIDERLKMTAVSKLAQANSPISLTPHGEEIANKIKAQDILNRYKDSLEQEIDKYNHKNAYDIQVASFTVASSYFKNILNETDLNTIKNASFNEGVLLEDFLSSLFGILLRNMILSQKNIPIAEVDKHSPKQ